MSDQASNVCGNCGGAVAVNWLVCPLCGTPLPPPQVESTKQDVPLYIGPEQEAQRDHAFAGLALVILGVLGLIAGVAILATGDLSTIFSTAGLLSLAVTGGGGMLALLMGGVLAASSRRRSASRSATGHTPFAATPASRSPEQEQRRQAAAAAATGVAAAAGGLAVSFGAILLGVVLGAVLVVATIIHLIESCFAGLGVH